MTTQHYDPHVERSTAALMSEADDIDRALRGDLDRDPRSVTGATCSNPNAPRRYTIEPAYREPAAA